MKVGILGGGQLARMLAEAGRPLGLEFLIVDPKPDACAASGGEFIAADYTDARALARLAECDRVTCDFENVPADALAWLEARVAVHPSAAALAVAQDRLIEKNRFVELDIATPAFAAVDSRADLAAAVDRIGLPAVIKTRRFGYDGKGQAVLRDVEDLELAWRELGDAALIVEQWIGFDYECAVTAVRGRDGETRCWPVSRTWHRDGILRLAGPLPVPEAIRQGAERRVRRLVDALDFVGCLTLELFVAGDLLLANEFAPRVHNSAHWTLEGAGCSQFDNHLRAVCGLPLGETAPRGQSLMVNFIGGLPDRDPWLALQGLAWHDYRKAPRPGRKVGHATQLAPTVETLAARLEALAAVCSEPQLAEVRAALPEPAA